MRRTKIVATIGPATDTLPQLEALLLSGVNVVRLNFSHGHSSDHQRRVEMIRDICHRHQLHIAIMGDLQGPKIRIARFTNTKVTLKSGQQFTLDTTLDNDAGDSEQVGIDYPQLIADCELGDELLLDDGRVTMQVIEKTNTSLVCTVINGGPLSNNKGINKKGGGLSAAALTDKDKQDILIAAQLELDYLAVSFPRNAADMHYARELVTASGANCRLVAKIERAEAVANDQVLDELILASDVVMVARGDLGVEIGDAALIATQKKIISRARKLNRVVITATQMMESMIDSPLPTRAEVFDVANAVLDGTDAVMLSAETAAGSYPVETVQAMDRIILGAEQDRSTRESNHRLNREFEQVDETIAMSAMYAANHMPGVKAIICLTESGNTTLLMSRISSGIPIIAMSRHPQTSRRVAMYRGVQTIPFDTGTALNAEVNQRAVESLVERGFVSAGDFVLITKGDYVDAQGGTNTMKLVKVGGEVR
ncbi:MAG: pyruvate kinase [Pseudomonadales bacterium]|nr:pyruvate kinase [Pseudomonadales bacterium]NRA14814.1 pyruvate kinase [Oceanospirillaceae bacterium]